LFDLLNTTKPANNGTAIFPAAGGVRLIEILLKMNSSKLQIQSTRKIIR